jgi:hypothetical protein
MMMMMMMMRKRRRRRILILAMLNTRGERRKFQYKLVGLYLLLRTIYQSNRTFPKKSYSSFSSFMSRTYA